MSPALQSNQAAVTVLEEADAVIDRLIPLTAGGGASRDLQEHLAAAWFRRIESLRLLGRADEIVAAADALCAHFAAAEGTGPAEPPPAAWIARALHEKKTALIDLGEFGPALDAMKVLRDRFGGSDMPEVREIVATAVLDEISLRASAGTPFVKVDMVRRCEWLIDHFGRDDRAETRIVIARTRARQAGLLAELDDPDEALARYTALHQDLCHAADPALREQAADALLAKARLLAGLDRRDEAQAALRRIVADYADATHPGQRETLAMAQMDLVLDLWFRRDEGSSDPERDALLRAALDAVLLSHADSADTSVLRCVNRAMRLKSEILRESRADGDRAQADVLTEQQWTRYGDHPHPSIQHEVLLAMLDRLDARPLPDALAGYRQLLDRFGDSEAGMLQASLARTVLLEAWALRQLERTPDALAALAILDARYAGSEDPAVRPYVVHGHIECARILRAEGNHAAALAALDALAGRHDLPDGDTPAGTELRKAMARGMALRAELWQDQVPPPEAPDHAEGDTAPHAAQTRQTDAVDALCGLFAADPSPEIRVIAAYALYDLTLDLRRHGHLQRLLDTSERYLATFAADTGPEIEAITAKAYLNQAYALMELMDRPAEALPVYDALVARFANATSDAMRVTLAKAAASRLTCLNRLQSRGVAVSYGASYPDLSLAERTAIGDTIARGRALCDSERHRDAIACYDEVLAAHGEALHPELRRLGADAMVRKAYSLSRLGQREAALAVNDALITRYGDDLSISIEKDVALAMSYRAIQLDKLGRHAEEVQTYDGIVARWAASDVAFLRERVASARYNKALTIADAELEEALALHRQVMEHLPAPETGLRLLAAKAAVERATRLRRAGRHADAIACGEALMQACGAETNRAIAGHVVKACGDAVGSYEHLGQQDRGAIQIEPLLRMPKDMLNNVERAALWAAYRRLRPAATAIGKAAQALGDYFGIRR